MEDQRFMFEVGFWGRAGGLVESKCINLYMKHVLYIT